MDLSKPNKQRIKDVFNRRMPDRVPNFEILVDNPTLSAIMQRPMPKHTLDNIAPQDYMAFSDRIGQDVIGMCFYYSPFFYEGKDGQRKPLDFRITCRDDLKRLLPPDLSWLDEHFSLLDEYARTVAGTETGLFILTGSFFTSAYDSIFGFENFMYTLFDDLPLIEEVLEIGASFYVELAKKVCERDLTFFYVGDDIAFKSTTLIDPNMLRQIWLPRLRRIFAPALSRKIPILYHSDGNIIEMIPDLIESGINALNPIEPYGMDIQTVKREFGRDIALVGNLDVGGNLSLGTPDDVRREACDLINSVGGNLSLGTPDDVRLEARDLINSVGHDGGLVLASSHSITRNVKPENFMAMVETAWTDGRYS